MIAAAGEYYDRTDISVEDVTNPEFQTWLAELMGAATDLSGGSAYTAEDFALFGYTAGDGGQFLESDLLQNLQGILTRWEEPPIILYPRFVTWFDFPFSVWVGPETSALEKNAALAFQRFLLNETQQHKALGLRPAPSQPHCTSQCHRGQPLCALAGAGRTGCGAAHNSYALAKPRCPTSSPALV